MQASFELWLCVHTSITREVNVYFVVWFWLWDPTVALLHYLTILFQLLRLCNVEWRVEGWVRMMKSDGLDGRDLYDRFGLTDPSFDRRVGGKPSEFWGSGSVEKFSLHFISSASSYAIINSVPFSAKQDIMSRTSSNEIVVHAESTGSAVMILTYTG